MFEQSQPIKIILHTWLQFSFHLLVTFDLLVDKPDHPSASLPTTTKVLDFDLIILDIIIPVHALFKGKNHLSGLFKAQ